MGLGKASGRGLGFGFGRGRGYGYGRGLGEGSGGFNGYSCVKFVFFGFNVFFWLLGCAILGVGIWLQMAKGSYAVLSPDWNFISPTALCISAGILVLVVGFFGCCGAIMESKCLLTTYFILIVVIFVLEVVGGVLAFIYGSQIEDRLAYELKSGIKHSYPTSEKQPTKHEESFKEVWSAIQTNKVIRSFTCNPLENIDYLYDIIPQVNPFNPRIWRQTINTFRTFSEFLLKCCGVLNASDWYGIDAWKGQNRVPRECCVNNATCVELDRPDLYHNVGCLENVKGHVQQNLLILGVVGICVGVLQILGLIASMGLCCCIRNSKFYDE